MSSAGKLLGEAKSTASLDYFFPFFLFFFSLASFYAIVLLSVEEMIIERRSTPIPLFLCVSRSQIISTTFLSASPLLSSLFFLPFHVTLGRRGIPRVNLLILLAPLHVGKTPTQPGDLIPFSFFFLFPPGPLRAAQ